MRWSSLVLACALALGVATPAVRAQPAPHPASQARREQIKERIRALRAYALTSQLSLDQATAGKLFPLLARYDDELDKLLVQHVALLRRLRQADKLRDPAAINQLIDEALANQRALWNLEEQRITDLRKILTPAQTARVLIVLPAFERRIQKLLQQAIRGARKAPRRAQPALDDGDDGDDGGM
jgi:Spy/CpxP family protein refolding chaperone